MNKTTAIAPDRCDICEGKLKSGKAFYDAKIPGGPWAWICQRCARLHGISLGLGRGQKYDSVTNEKLQG